MQVLHTAKSEIHSEFIHTLHRVSPQGRPVSERRRVTATPRLAFFSLPAPTREDISTSPWLKTWRRYFRFLRDNSLQIVQLKPGVVGKESDDLAAHDVSTRILSLFAQFIPGLKKHFGIWGQI